MRHWILDTEPTFQRVALRRFILRICESIDETDPRCLVVRVSGQGAGVQALEQRLGRARPVPAPVPVPVARLLHLATGTRQACFHELEAYLPDHAVRFGLREQVAMFIQAPPDLAHRVVQPFQDRRPHDPRPCNRQP